MRNKRILVDLLKTEAKLKIVSLQWERGAGSSSPRIITNIKH